MVFSSNIYQIFGPPKRKVCNGKCEQKIDDLGGTPIPGNLRMVCNDKHKYEHAIEWEIYEHIVIFHGI